MPAEQARAVIERELGAPLEALFEWIDLETPLGSASISQVGWGAEAGLARRVGNVGCGQLAECACARLPASLVGTPSPHPLPLNEQVHKAKLRCPSKKKKKKDPFLRPVWDLLRGGYAPADIAPSGR